MVFLAAIAGAAAMWIVSLLTPPPPAEVLAGEFWLFRKRNAMGSGEAGAGRPARKGALLADSRLWAAALFAAVTALWIAFR
jgi:hypothetical protein